MLLYSKLHEFLTGTSSTSVGPPLKCSVVELYGRSGGLRYIYFNTENNVPCLLYISPKHEINMEEKKYIDIVRWQKPKNPEETIDAQTFSAVRNIQSKISPKKYIDFLLRLAPALGLITYKVGVISKEYLTVLDEDNDVDIFYVNGPKEPKLLIVLTLETILNINVISEIERVHKNVSEMIQNSTSKYWELLMKLLKECEKNKIVTSGTKLQHNIGLITMNTKIASSYLAIKSALECYEEIKMESD